MALSKLATRRNIPSVKLPKDKRNLEVQFGDQVVRLTNLDTLFRPKLGVASFSDASFPEPKRAMFRFEVPPMVLPESTQLMPKLSWKTQGGAFPGRFRGNVRQGGEIRAFSGVFFSKQRTAEGFFLKQGGSGVVRLGVKED